MIAHRTQARLWPYFIQVIWIVVAVLATALFADSVAARHDQLLRAAIPYRRALHDLQLSTSFFAGYLTIVDITLILAHVAIATFIFWRAADAPIAVFVALSLVTTPLTAIGALQSGSPLTNLLTGVIRYMGLTTGVTLLYLFPDGRFVPRPTRILALWWALLNLPTIFLPASPLSLGAWPLTLQAIILLTFTISGVYAQAYRYFHISTDRQRRQARWATLGLIAAVLGPYGYYFNLLTLPSLSRGATPSIFYNLADPDLFTFALLVRLGGVTVYALALLVFPLSLALSVLRDRLFDIEIVLNRTLVYAALTGAVVALYVLVVGALGHILQAQDNVVLAILATGLIAILFQPLRQRLQQGVNRLMYGERDDPVTVLTRLGERLEHTAVPEATLPVLVETIAQTLKLPYVALILQRDEAAGARHELIAEHGSPTAHSVAFALVFRQHHLGRLLVAQRAPGETFTAAEQHLLQNIARQASAAVYALHLTRQLQRSRERLVTTREEERRRLRRDLHDGLGPRLATLTLKVDAANNYLHDQPQVTGALLHELRSEIQEALQDVRRMAYALRPPALDQLGLAPALNEYASRNSVNGLHINVETGNGLPPLPAAVEVAAYHIALEAITNAARHAHASHCTVRCTASRTPAPSASTERVTAQTHFLQLEIEDNGLGLSPNAVPGVGLASMRERAAELGGTFDLHSTPQRGTHITVSLPIGREQI